MGDRLFDLLLWSGLAGVGIFSAGHALLHKRDPRAALGWIVTALALPGVGPVLYWLFGVNRIRSRVRGWQERGMGLPGRKAPACAWSGDLAASEVPFRRENFASLLALTDAITRRPLVGGNRVWPLFDGEQAFPAMLASIEGAGRSISLASYIFESNETGGTFVAALGRAVARGVNVRVLIDALGERYSWPLIHRLLKRQGVRTARFLPFSLSGRGIYFNLRNHRKLLVVDGRVGFTGGMNLGDRHLAAGDNPRRVRDLHFQVEGPVVAQLQAAFDEDWVFTTGEEAPPPAPNPPTMAGRAFCRGISAGPNEDFEKLGWLVTGALDCARQRVRVMTPYFIPDRSLVTAFCMAALRGVAVELVLPGKNNLPYVAWASRAHLWELLQHGIRIYFQPPPFVHSKLLLVDDEYALVGSANLDPRSLRLNFEFNLEVYDPGLHARLADYFDRSREAAREVSLEEVDRRSLPVRLRDSAAKLFSPYL